MPVPSSITDLDVVAGNNFPQSTDSVGATLYTMHQAWCSILKKQAVKGANIAVVASGVVSLPVDEGYYELTGTGVNITGFSSAFAGRKVRIKFTSAGLTLINSATFKLPNNVNYVTKAGDIIDFVADTTSIWIASGLTSFTTLLNDLSIELGSLTSANTPFIDFHSGAVATDYDSRIVANGGTGASGGGTLSVQATNINLTGNTANSGTLAVTGTLSPNAVTVQNNADVSGIGSLFLNPTVGNGNLNLGRFSGAVSTPYIDFRSASQAGFVDSRIIANGGIVGQNFRGNINIQSGSLQFNGEQIDSFPSGTRLVFYQSGAPLGWTNIGLGANYTLVTGTGGTAAGGGGAGHNIVTGCTVVAAHTHDIDPVAIATSTESANHTHAMNADGRAVAKRAGADSIIDGTSGSASVEDANYSGSQSTGAQIGSHTHSVDIPLTTTSSQTNTGTWQPFYVTVIVCSKN